MDAGSKADTRVSSLSVPGLLEKALSTHGDTIAITDGIVSYSYAALDNLSRCVATHLVHMGIELGTPVLVNGIRKITTFVIAIGVLRAGACLVFVDASWSPERLGAIIQQTGSPVLITDGLHGLSSAGRTVVVSQAELFTSATAERLTSVSQSIAPVAPCTMFCTSGTTGYPKLVLSSSESLADYLRWQVAETAVGPGDRFSQLALLVFDFSLKEWLAPLVAGGTVVVASNLVRFDSIALLRWLQAERVTIACLLPSTLRALINVLRTGAHGLQIPDSLRLLMISGEPLHSHSVIEWQHLVGQVPALMNLYGPTESTVIKLRYRIPFPYHAGSTIVPLGQPIPGTDVVILNGEGNPSAAGETGEICLVGEHFADGYHGDAEATTRVFVTTGLEGSCSAKTLRTGDLGYKDSDGSVIFAGRKDRQLKRFGIRIDLDEIESAAVASGAVSVAAAVAYQDTDPQVTLAITPAFDSPSATALVRRHLISRMPAAQHPDRIVELANIPTLPNGKLDYRSLALQLQQSYTLSNPAPASSALVLATWCKVLDRQVNDAEATFFELGGTSALLLNVLQVLRDEGYWWLTLVDLLTNPTASALAAFINLKHLREDFHDNLTPVAARDTHTRVG